MAVKGHGIIKAWSLKGNRPLRSDEGWDLVEMEDPTIERKTRIQV